VRDHPQTIPTTQASPSSATQTQHVTRGLLFSSRAWMTVVLVGALGGLVACPQAPQVRQPVTTVVSSGNTGSNPGNSSSGGLSTLAVGDDGGPASAGCLRTADQLNKEPGWKTQGVPAYCGRARVLFPEPTDTTVVNDSEDYSGERGTDKVLTRALNVGEIRKPGIVVPIYVNTVVPNASTEAGVIKAIQNGILSEETILEMAVYDIDNTFKDQKDLPRWKCNGKDMKYTFKPEVDKVKFNDYWLENKSINPGSFEKSDLEGMNNKWTLYTEIPEKEIEKKYGLDWKKKYERKEALKIPTRWLRFPTEANTYAKNELKIYLDTAAQNQGKTCPNSTEETKVWSAEVDWVSLSFKATAPAFFVHGINTDDLGASMSTFQNMSDEFRAANIPTSWPPISMPQRDVIPQLDRNYFCEDYDYFKTRKINAARILGEIAVTKAQTGPNKEDRTPNPNSGISSLGSTRVNLLGHSKGGLDIMTMISEYSESKKEESQVWLPQLASYRAMGQSVPATGAPASFSFENWRSNLARKISIESYISFNSPHGGSLLSDFSLNRTKGINVLSYKDKAKYTDNPLINPFFNFVGGDYSCELTAVRAFDESKRLKTENMSKIPILHVSTNIRYEDTITPLNPTTGTVQTEGLEPLWRMAGAGVTIETKSKTYSYPGDIEPLVFRPQNIPNLKRLKFNSNETVVAVWGHQALNTIFGDHFKMYFDVPNQAHTGAVSKGFVAKVLTPELLNPNTRAISWRVKP
jgi:hypothetical protein